MSSDRLPMIEILSAILSRLVNVALFLVITALTLLFLRGRTDLELGVIAVISLVVGVLGTIIVRWVLRLVHRLWRRIFPAPTN